MRIDFPWIAFVVAVLTASPAQAFKDLATRADATGSEFYVGFCARPSPAGGLLDGKPGHMFVSFSERYADGSHDFIAIGHTTDGGKAAALTFLAGAVDGVMREELFSHIHEKCLSVRVNREDFEAARLEVAVAENVADIIGIKGRIPIYEDYKLGSEDCMTYAIKVARRLEPLGLIVLERENGELPMDYLERLILVN